jgi:hypothetical protein
MALELLPNQPTLSPRSPYTSAQSVLIHAQPQTLMPPQGLRSTPPDILQ